MMNLEDVLEFKSHHLPAAVCRSRFPQATYPAQIPGEIPQIPGEIPRANRR